MQGGNDLLGQKEPQTFLEQYFYYLFTFISIFYFDILFIYLFIYQYNISVTHPTIL